MEKYYEVIEITLDLLETLAEGLDNALIQVKRLSYEEAFTVLTDVMEGIASIEEALGPIETKLPENKINILASTLIEGMSKAVTSYEQGQQMNLESQLAEEIIPSFKKWQEEIQRVLKPYMVS